MRSALHSKAASTVAEGRAPLSMNRDTCCPKALLDDHPTPGAMPQTRAGLRRDKLRTFLRASGEEMGSCDTSNSSANGTPSTVMVSLCTGLNACACPADRNRINNTVFQPFGLKKGAGMAPSSFPIMVVNRRSLCTRLSAVRHPKAASKARLAWDRWLAFPPAKPLLLGVLALQDWKTLVAKHLRC